MVIKEGNKTKNWLKDDNRIVSVDIWCLVYNHGKYLRQALDSILMQKTSFPVRIIIHDDASLDDSADIIKEYRARFPDKIVAILEEQNLVQNGKSVFRKMVPYFTAKYIAYCEGDDYWTDDKKLQKQVDYLESHPDCVAVYHNILPVDKNGKHNEALRGIYPILEEGNYSEKELKNFVLKTQFASLVMRNYYPWMTEEQMDFYAQVKCNGDERSLILSSIIGRIHYLPDVMAAHRRVINEGDSWTARQNRKSKSERMLELQKRYLEKCRLHHYFSGIKPYPYNFLINERINYLKAAKHEGLSYKQRINNLKCIQIPIYAYIVYIPLFIRRGMRSVYRRLRK